MNGVCETQALIRCEALLDKQKCRTPWSVVVRYQQMYETKLKKEKQNTVKQPKMSVCMKIKH